MIRPRIQRVLAFAAPILLLLASCYSITHSYEGPKELTPGTKLTRQSTKVCDIDGGGSAWFLIWGIVPLSRANGPQMAALLADRAVGPNGWDGITHLHISEQLDALGTILMFVTVGLVSRYTVDFTGQVDRFSN